MAHRVPTVGTAEDAWRSAKCAGVGGAARVAPSTTSAPDASGAQATAPSASAAGGTGGSLSSAYKRLLFTACNVLDS